jgi:hypothetical protein
MGSLDCILVLLFLLGMSIDQLPMDFTLDSAIEQAFLVFNLILELELLRNFIEFLLLLLQLFHLLIEIVD